MLQETLNTAKWSAFPLSAEVAFSMSSITRSAISPYNNKHSVEEGQGLPQRRQMKNLWGKDVAVRKYLAKDHLWYFPPAEMFEKSFGSLCK